MITLARLLENWRLAASSDPLDVRTEVERAPNAELARRVCLATLFAPERVEAQLENATIATGELAALDIVNALACAGIRGESQRAGALPNTPHAALAVLALQGPVEAARLLPAAAGTPRVGDLAATVDHVIACVREQRGIDAAFLAWHTLVASCTEGEADAAMLFWMARVVVHTIGGKPLDSIARWIRDTLEKAARVQEHAITTDRERARIELLDDPDRLAARPEQRLQTWQRSAKPVVELVDVPLVELGAELARSIVVDPHQPVASPILERLRSATPIGPAEHTSILDALHALACTGAVGADELRTRTREWLPGANWQHGAPRDRIRAALAALAVCEVDLAARIVPEPGGTFVAGRAFGNDIVGAVGTIVAAVRAHAVVATLDRQLQRIAEELDALCATEQLDEATLLWLARVVFADIDRRPVGEVASAAREWLFGTPQRLTAARRDAISRARTFPLDRTLDNGRYRIDRWLLGTGAQRLYRGFDTVSEQVVAIAFDDHAPARQSVDELRAAVSNGAPGILDLAFVGTLDNDRDHWAVVERVPASGRWLPLLFGAPDPAAAVRVAVSAGLILVRAAKAGLAIRDVRPELMWAERSAAGIEVVGLSTRAAELFRRRRSELVSRPLFEHSYGAPEPTFDSRSVAFSLAVMTVRWATGRVASAGDQVAGVAEPLGGLLRRALRAEPEGRPSLEELVAELDALAR